MTREPARWALPSWTGGSSSTTASRPCTESGLPTSGCRKAGRLDAVIEAMADGVYVYDREGRPQKTNAALRRLLLRLAVELHRAPRLDVHRVGADQRVVRVVDDVDELAARFK